MFERSLGYEQVLYMDCEDKQVVLNAGFRCTVHLKNPGSLTIKGGYQNKIFVYGQRINPNVEGYENEVTSHPVSEWNNSWVAEEFVPTISIDQQLNVAGGDAPYSVSSVGAGSDRQPVVIEGSGNVVGNGNKVGPQATGFPFLEPSMMVPRESGATSRICGDASSQMLDLLRTMPLGDYIVRGGQLIPYAQATLAEQRRFDEQYAKGGKFNSVFRQS